MSIRSIVGLALIVPAAIVVMLVLTASEPTKGQLGPRQAEAACTKAAPDCLPNITIMDTDQEVFPPEALKGKVVVVNFWATWCPPCKREIPAFNQVYTEYKDKGVVFLGLVQDADISPAQLLNFASDHEMTYPIVTMDGDQGNDIARNFGMPSNIPTTFVYDKTGARRMNNTGSLEADELRAILDRLLAE
jgi:thiol-disulfide isomerase/thioredoxin